MCDEMHRLMSQFWWGDKDDKKSLHWLSWEKMCLSKQEGGLGFKDMRVFNLALLAKQGWRLIQSPESLVARFLKAKYFPNTSFMKAEVKAGSSYVWRSLLAGRKVLNKGLRFQIGCGSQVSVWEDKWCLCLTGFNRSHCLWRVLKIC